MKTKQERIGLVGLGYVGLPLAVAFAEKLEVVGYAKSEARVRELLSRSDHTGEVDRDSLYNKRLSFTCSIRDLSDCTFIVVAVPTPVTRSNEPDLSPLEAVSSAVGKILAKGMMVVYESTVFPGVTEEICLPILERESGLKLGDFGLGYSPERVNPGDDKHRITDIVKVVSAHDAEGLARVADTYGAIVEAGVHRAPDIKTAEASKVIENVQRDLNIALMNELSKIFSAIGINTNEVLTASATKWNFHRYNPGLVGGHCIGVDPYYLTHLALRLGYHPEVILAGRRINDTMGGYVGELIIREMNAAGARIKGAHAWILGMTFKQNVPDLRNTKAVDVIDYLKGFGVKVSVWEPLVGDDEIKTAFGLEALAFDGASGLDAVVLVSGHDVFRSIDLTELRKKMRTPVLVDVRNFFDRAAALKAGFRYRSL